MFGDGDAKKRRREDNTGVIEFDKSAKSCLPQFKQKRNVEYIHIAIVACHKDRIKEAFVNLKTITLITNYYIYFHIFTDDKSYDDQTFEKELKTWPAFKEQWMMYSTQQLSYPFDDGTTKWPTLFKPCASQRLFLANILVSVDSVIYIDTDILFLQPPENLWRYFKHFNHSQIAGLVNECEKNGTTCWYSNHVTHPYYAPYGVNSGVMLMNLTRMRKLNWEDDIINIFNLYKEDYIPWGDQDLLNIYFHSHRNFLYILPCTWNYRPDHCMHGNVCKQARYDGISLLHGSREVFHSRKKQPEYYVVYQNFKKYVFKGNLEKIVNETREDLSSKKYRRTPCGKMRDEILHHIECK